MAPLNCDDADTCTADSCNEVNGCANDPIDGPGCNEPVLVPKIPASSQWSLLVSALLMAVLIEYARRRCADVDGVEFEIEDLLDLPDAVSFDIVHCALVLHHFEGDAAVAALRKMFALSRWGVVINELHRHPLAYYSIKLLTRLFSESLMIRNDAPLSVLRAFQREDFQRLALEADLPEPSIRWHWAFRWCVLFRK